MDKLLKYSSKYNLPLIVIDIYNEIFINTLVIDVSNNGDINHAGYQYGIPGIYFNSYNSVDVEKYGKAVVKYICSFKVHVFLQVHTYQFVVY